MASELLGKAYPAKAIGDLWKKLLTNQFHDILPGSSIHQVYEDCDAIYRDMFRGANAIYDEAIASLNAALGLRSDQIAVWNFLGWNLTGSVCARIPGRWTSLKDDKGAPIHASAFFDGVDTQFRFEAADVPALGVHIYTACVEPCETSALSASVCCLENAHLKLTLDENGNIASLWDKHARREVFTGEQPSNRLLIFEDIPHRESAWNIDIEYMNRCWPLDKAESVELVENTPVRAVVRTVRRFNLSTITQDIVLARDARRVDFETHVDWRETERMLKAAFYADVLSPKATYEIQFGAIERPTHWNTSYDKARFEVCGHKWADLSEGLYGVSLLNDCKYGYDVKAHCMRLTLLRSPNYPDPVGDKGEHDFVYSIYPHSGDWRTGDTVREAYALNVPLMAETTSTAAATSLESFSFAQIDRPNVVIDTVKGAEDGEGFIVRVYESQGARCHAQLSFAFDLSEVRECNLMECDEQAISADKNRFDFYIKPYEIKTFRVFKAK